MRSTEVKVFVSCPGDVEKDATRIKDLCETLTPEFIKKFNIELEVKSIYWKNNNQIEKRFTGEPPQDSINRQLEEHDYDIYIGILWTRFGTIDEQKKMAPTQEEFEEALKKYKAAGYPYVHFFFKKTNIGYPKSQYDIDELRKIFEFKDSISNKGLYFEYKQKDEFDTEVRRIIGKYIEDKIRSHNPSGIKKTLDTEVKSSIVELSYIMERSVCKASNDDASSWLLFEGEKLCDLLKDNSKIVLLGDAGTGKSVELKKLANHFSSSDSFYNPFFIELKKYISGNIVEMLPENWSDTPEEQRLFIFDGLDEVEPIYQNTVRKGIVQLAEKSQSSRYVVSCRKNFYNVQEEGSAGSLTGFTEYKFVDLSYKESSKYEVSVLDKEGKELFEELIRQNELFEFLRNPFYLVNLVNMYKERNNIPEDKTDLLRAFIDSRLAFDIRHFKYSVGENLQENKHSIIISLQKLALAMETMGVASIASKDLSSFINDKTIIKLLQFGTLVSIKNKGTEKESYQFEHNNFREYLAASALTEQSIGIIKSLIYNEQLGKIKPQWGNTVHFLISIRENNDLFNWILDIEPEILVKSESGKLSKEKRIEIFKEIFNKYAKKKIWIDTSTYFDYRELARFGQCDEIIEFLLSQDIENLPHITLMETIRFLGEMDIPEKDKDFVKDLLYNKAIDNQRGQYVQSRAICSLESHKEWVEDNNLIGDLVDKLKGSNNEYIYSALYSLINKSPYINKYIQFYLDGITSYCKRWHDGTGTTLLDESFELSKGIQKVTGIGYIKLIEFITENYSDFSRLQSLESDNIIILRENAVKEYSNNKCLFDIMYNLLLKMHSDYGKLTYFFNQTKTTQKAINNLLTHASRHWHRCNIIGAIADRNAIDKICADYQQKKHTDEFMQDLLNCTSNADGVYDYFYKKINKETSNKFIKEEVDYKKLEKEKAQKYFDLLFDKDKFFSEIEAIFESKQTLELTHDEISSICYREKNNFPQKILHEMNSLSIDNEVNEKKVVSLEEVIAFYDKDWMLFSSLGIYKELKRNSEMLNVSGEKVKHIKTIYEFYLNKLEFRTIFSASINEEGRYTFTNDYRAMMVIFFLLEFKFTAPESKLNDLLFYDCNGVVKKGWLGIEYLEELYSDISVMTQQVLHNINNENLSPIALKNHIDYCYRHKIQDALSKAIDVLVDDTTYDATMEACLDYICDISEDWIKILEEALNKVSNKFKWNIIDKLIPENSSVCRDYLEKLMIDGKEKQDRYQAIEKALSMKSLKALKCYNDVVVELGTIPHETSHIEPNLVMNSLEEALPYYISLLKVSYTSKVEDDIGISRLRRRVQEVLRQYALVNKENYDTITISLKNCIKENSGIDNINSINYVIEDIEKSYLINSSQQLTCDEVKEKIDKIFEGS